MKLLRSVHMVMAIARRELLSLFVTPAAYVVWTLFLLQQGWDFALLLRILNDPLAAPGPVMQFYFGGSFFIFWLPVVFTCAAVSMRALAEERRQGTLEALLTAPLSATQIVVGKFVAALVFYVVLWLPTLAFYLLLRGAAVEPDVGPVLSGYLGTFLVGASFLAVGLVASAAARSQLGAAVSTVVVCSIMLLAGLLTEGIAAGVFADMLASTSLLAMMQDLALGIVDTRWIVLHTCLTIAALVLAAFVLSPRRTLERALQVTLVWIIAINGAVLGTRHSTRQDWTGGRIYSLSERALDVLAALEGPIDVTVVIPSSMGGGRPNPVAAELREVMLRMTKATQALRVRFLDPDRDRQAAERWVAEFGLSGRDLAEGVVLIRAGQGVGLRKAHLLPNELVTFATGPDVQQTGPRIEEFRGEEALLSKFIEVAEARRIRACVTQGHGEPELDNLEPYAGFAHFADLLADANIEVVRAPLQGSLSTGDCDLLIIAGAKGAFPAGEIDAIRAYVERGGDILLLSGAVILRGRETLANSGLESIAAQFGVRFGQRVVLDPHAMPGETPLLAFTLSEGWGAHPAVRALVGRPVSFVLARELFVDERAQGAWVWMESSEASWAEADIGGLAKGLPPVVEPRADRQGKIPLVAAAQHGEARLVVVASDQFALNAYLREDVVYDHGRDLVLSSVAWLTRRDTLLGLRARRREHVKLVLTDDQIDRMTWMCLLGLPSFAVFLGVWVLWRRR